MCMLGRFSESLADEFLADLEEGEEENNEHSIEQDKEDEEASNGSFNEEEDKEVILS